MLPLSFSPSFVVLVAFHVSLVGMTKTQRKDAIKGEMGKMSCTLTVCFISQPLLYASRAQSCWNDLPHPNVLHL